MRKVNIANPIYDSVFKYLLEDERIAKTLLSALIKKEVVHVEARPHEYTNLNRDTISMFRIDFSAKVREKDGSLHLVLIELQKTWVETETLRFRQYLGAQYSLPGNMQDDGKYGIPMVTVYIMGHKIGDIDEPIIYSNHRVEDYDGNPITKGIPDPFVESLTHNSIIVQIPLLHGQVNNRLEQVLTVFDQTKTNKEDNKVLQIDETLYNGDIDMQYIVHRLTAAAADAEMRHQMNVEDEYFSIIEKHDTELMEAKRDLAASRIELAENKAALVQSKVELEENKAALEEKDAALAQKEQQIISMIQGMYAAGMSMESVAQAANTSLEFVQRCIKQ